MEYVIRRAADFSEIQEIYNSRMRQDFARNELKPLAAVRRAWKRNAYDVFFLTDGETVLGYACFVRNGNHLLFDYFAIAKEYRDKGLGSLFLKQLTEFFARAECVLGEVEDPERADNENERAVRERRLQFYIRNGYIKTKVISNVFGVDYRILEVPVGAEHSTEDIQKIYSALYRSILPFVFYETQFIVKEQGKQHESAG